MDNIEPESGPYRIREAREDNILHATSYRHAGHPLLPQLLGDTEGSSSSCKVTAQRTYTIHFERWKCSLSVYVGQSPGWVGSMLAWSGPMI